jgi:prepilin-type N-terminal cleavage/methylation domain-containing protein
MGKQRKVTSDLQGFTLVELSIVLIIIALIITGILVGKSLIVQAGISSIIRDMQATQTSYNSYIYRYEAIPGDHANAANFWANCADINLACNGNGDRLIEYSTTPIGASGIGDEVVRVYRHLSLANMINSAGGDQLLNGVSGGNLILGTDVPTSKITGSGFFVAGPIADIGAGSAYASPWFGDNKNNAVFIGVKKPDFGLVLSALSADDAFSIDKKVDDGVVNANFQSIGAATGEFRSIDGFDANQYDCQQNNVYNTGYEKLVCVSGFSLD